MIRRNTSLLLFIFLMNGFIYAQEKQYAIHSIGFYNLENLFDTEDDPKIRDEEYTPDGFRLWDEKRYQNKLQNMATIIAQLGVDKSKDGLTILGVSEVENRKVLEDLVAHPFIKSRDYKIVHFDSPDRRGIDVALLYQEKYFQPVHSEAKPLLLYRNDSSRVFTRDILYVKGMLDGEPIHLMVNHWPSRSGGEARTINYRALGALVCKNLVDSLTQINPNEKIIIMGDLNDDPTSPSIKKVLQAEGKIKDTGAGELFNPMQDFYNKGFGTNAWRDTWSLFDQIIVSSGLIDKEQDGYFFHKAVIYNKKFMTQKTGAFKGYPFRTFGGSQYTNGYSDHFPVFVYLIKEINQ